MTGPDIGREGEALEVYKGILVLYRAERLHFEVFGDKAERRHAAD
jgi:hypothetical protein